MLIDRRNFWKLHGRWLLATLAASGIALAWCALSSVITGRWPGGGSLPGLVLGIAAAAIFLFELALAAKKTSRFRTARWALSAQTWMKAHIWLGLLSVPLVVLHSGGQLGGTLTTLLVVTFAVIILSGLWGLAVQNFLPRMLLDAVPAETVYSQIDAVGGQYAAEASRLVTLYCGTDEAEESRPTVPVGHEPSTRPAPRHFGPQSRPTVPVGHELPAIPGAPRNVGPQVKRSPHPERELPQPIPSPTIRGAFQQAIGPYLITGDTNQGLLGSRQRNQWYFDDLRLRVVPELRALVDQLENLCERRRQLNLQRRLHFWLHNWLWLHLPLSLILIILLVGHIIYALRFG